MYEEQTSSFLDSKFFNVEYLFSVMDKFVRGIFNFVFRGETGDFLINLFSVLAIIALVFMAYAFVRMFEIRAKEHRHLKHEIAEYAEHMAREEEKRLQGVGISHNPRWRQVLAYVVSDNMNDWKLAIIEADSMLESLMNDMGFKGENLGEKLKSADQDKFRSLTAAWEVHTVRNRIAHEGAAFQLSAQEAKRIVALYEQIFREFGYI